MRFDSTKLKTMLSQSLDRTFPIKKSAWRENGNSRAVVYFYQGLGTAHSKGLSKYAFATFSYAKKLKKEKNKKMESKLRIFFEYAPVILFHFLVSGPSTSFLVQTKKKLVL